MAIYTCKMCGGELEIMEGNVCSCLYCGRTQTIPTGNDEKKINLFNRANALRARNEFDAAATVFESIVSEFPDEAEAYWGLCLCRYGIEYVEDPATHVRKPTCHRTEYESILNDSDYLQATRLASAMSRHLYEDEAREIDRLQKEILAIASNEQDYDIFICYKETDELGNRTQDSVIAMDIYKELTKEGYKVFFARITLEGKLGEAYEPIIFSALHSAKVMLVVGTKPEYFNAVWVKNEWSRFQKMMKTDSAKRIFPCYANMNAYEIPREINIVQAQDLSKIGAVQDLVWNIGKVIPKQSLQNMQMQNMQMQAAVSAGSSIVDNLLTRAEMKLDADKWDEAREFYDKALNENPKEARAYLGLLFTEFKVKKTKDLARFVDKWMLDNENYQYIQKFGEPALKEELGSYVRDYTEKETRKAEIAQRKREEGMRRKAEADEKMRAMGVDKDQWRAQMRLQKNVGSSSDSANTASSTQDTSKDFVPLGEKLLLYQGKAENVTIPNGFKVIGATSFKDVLSMKTLIIPDGVEVIEWAAFSGCINLERVEIADSVKEIGFTAFSNCSNLKSIRLPQSFLNEEKVKEINIDLSRVSIDGFSTAPAAFASEPVPASASSQVQSSGDGAFVDIELSNVGIAKMGVISVLREKAGIDTLSEAMQLVDNAPVIIKRGVPRTEAQEIKSALEERGATVNLI